MKKRSPKSDLILIRAEDIPPPTEAQMLRLRRGSVASPNLSDIVEGLIGRTPEYKTPDSDVLKSEIRLAIVREMNRRKLSGYGIWKRATPHCKTLPMSAIYEFLRGERQIGTRYLEAIMAALELKLVGTKRGSKPEKSRRTKAA